MTGEGTLVPQGVSLMAVAHKHEPNTVPLLPIFAQAGHRTTQIYVKRNDIKCDDANRKVIDFLKGDVPHLTAQDVQS